jgi:cysteine sulfinate desulfinase/cysteine desulfurase-like protein
MRGIYLDHNASTPMDPAVVAAMRPYLEEAYGNPSSGHWTAAPAKAAIERARGQVAALLRCAPNVSFVGRIGAKILAGLDGVAASTGSACHAGRVELSPVLKAMGVPPELNGCHPLQPWSEFVVG